MQTAKPTRRPATPVAVGPTPMDYAEFVQEVWGTVCPLIGAITLSALVLSSIRRASREHELLLPVTVTVDGVDVEALVKALSPADPKEQAAAMGELTKQLLAVFESIAGPIIVRQLMPLTIRLDQMIAVQKEKP